MAVQESTVINASVEQVIEAFSSEDFARFVCSEVGVEFGSFSVSGDTSAEFTATTEPVSYTHLTLPTILLV